MSIIHDALKKVQGQMAGSAAKTELSNRPILASEPPKQDREPPSRPKAPPLKTENSSSPAPVPSSKPQKSYVPLLAYALMVLVAVGLYVFVLAKNFNTPRQGGAGTPPPQAKTTRLNQPVIARFHVSGIMMREDGRVALINNEIYEVGETVGGCEIVQINENSVHILENGQVKVLKVK